MLQDTYKRDFKKRRQKFHLNELLGGLGEGQHCGDPPHRDRLTDTPEQGLGVSVQRLPVHQLQAQVVRQEIVAPSLRKAAEGAVQGSLDPCWLTGGHKRTQAHRVPDLSQDVTGLRVGVTGVDTDVHDDVEPEV